MADLAAPSRSWRQTLAVYRERATLAMYGLGFSCGLTFWLIYDTLTAWLRQSGLLLETIAFLTLATLPYAFKFLWAPVLDRAHVPVLTRMLGHRRSWTVVAQLAIMAGFTALALSDPVTHFPMMAAAAVFIGFSGATQDIVVDAWRIEVSPQSKQGAMLTAYQWGHRSGFLVSGVAPLLIADHFNWTLAYLAMAALMTVCIAATFYAPREVAHELRPIPRVEGNPRPWVDRIEWIARLLILLAGAVFLGSGLSGRDLLLTLFMPAPVAAAFDVLWKTPTVGLFVQVGMVAIGFAFIVFCAWPLPGRRTQPGLFLAHAFGDPLRDFFNRFGTFAWMMIALICFYRISQFLLNIMNPFYLDLGFTLTQIAEVRKVYGAIMDMVGVLLGGLAITRWGLMRCMVAGCVLAPMSNLTFAWLATQGASIPGLIICLGFNNVLQNFAGTCLIAYMSSLTSAGFTGTQYALFSSLYALPDKFIMTQSGRVIEGAARSADIGGFFAPLLMFFGAVPAASYVTGASRIGVAPASLGAGYMGYFFYTCLLGVSLLPVALIVYRRSLKARA
jgi:PAT family beta-lactamase induction signal transducer AmpG